MQIERKLTVLLLALVAVTTVSAQVSSARSGGGGGSQGTVAGRGALSKIQQNGVQQLISEAIIWKQMLALDDMGGERVANYNALPPALKDARMDVIRACNLYQRAILTAPMQKVYDDTILDPKGHPLPPKWEKMRLRGTLVDSLIKPTPEQEKKAQEAIAAFRNRNSAIWGKPEYADLPEAQSPYGKHLKLLIADLRSFLDKEQRAEFDALWTSYTKDIAAAVKAGAIQP